MSDVLKKFGRYFLLDQIAQGGMAEIYRARLASQDGAGRLLVIKRIQAGFGENTEFIQMFKSEIKVTMGFNHPNIVQLYDFGEEQSQPYIAMEFVDGKNLRQFLTRNNELKQSFPIEAAAYIIEQAASGLHYAHSYKDKITGQALNIVHRDISPQNIIVSYEGNAKVIDFGIAKAKTNSESTRAGVIKGKPSYLSPEQISGEVLDGGCDIFALGIVLWELLTGRKLFAGDNDLAVLKLIESCNQHVKPPSTLNPKVPKELDYIVLRALAKQREKRYQNGEELQRALHKFLYNFNPDFNPGDLAYFAKELFKNEIVEDRKKLQRLSEKAEQLLTSDAPAMMDMEIITGPARREDTTTIVDPKKAAQALKPGAGAPKIEIEAVAPRGTSGPRTRQTAGSAVGRGSSAGWNTDSAQPPNVPRQRPQESRGSGGKGGISFVKSVLFGAVALVAVAFIGPEFGVRVPVLSDYVSEAPTGQLLLTGNGKNLNVSVNGKTVANALPANLQSLPAGQSLQISVSGGGISYSENLVLKKGERRELAITSTNASPAAAATGVVSTIGSGKSGIVLRLNMIPTGPGGSLTVNGKAVDFNNPVVTVPLDEPLELVAERPGFRTFRREFVLESQQIGALKEWPMDVPMEPLRFGYVTIRTTPSADATVTIDGKSWVKKTPIENEKFPVGTYSIKLSNDVLGMEKIVTVSIQEGKAVSIDERLQIKN